MSVAERWDDDAFIRLMADLIPADPDEKDEPVNLAAERQNPVISWEEFAGDFT
ncbi:TPA: hypothetical protein ACPFO5_001630 [Citrobacter freundii]|uniref:hypothetical protein n=1 Tax=Citrobacter freundii TaxID=546 RepID=UPI00294079B1|nr:hypothetical protein [Citrobacter freundii]HED1561568.1 hypothetical protein [Citrobacter freundii]HED3110349.1 hypothetical protein [Citrobacter freundii]HED3115925.1 hypothetical protein [Citrobacter freundii]